MSNLVLTAFPAPTKGGVDVLFMAGEYSGDEHAARIIRKMKAEDPSLNIAAISGRNAAQAGAQLLFDLTRYSVIGFVEVLRHYSELKRIFDETIRWIEIYKPKLICFVDYPGFNLRIAKELDKRGLSAKAGGETRLMYYISPQIWAWKAGRRFDMARILDGLGVIFPFEVDCFADTDLDVRFVGHPFVQPHYQFSVHYDSKPHLLLLPGSRVQAVTRIFPILLKSFQALRATFPDLEATVVYPDEGILNVLQACIKKEGAEDLPLTLVDCDTEVRGSVVLMSSGTMSLQCALAGIPGIICYRAHPLTYWIGKSLVKISFLGIANLLMPENPPYPEYLQHAARPKVLAKALSNLLSDPVRSEAHGKATQASLNELLHSQNDWDMADWIMEMIRGS